MDVDLVALVGLSAADASCLQSLKPLMARNQDDVINAFYGRILAFPRFKAMIEKTCERDGLDIGQLVAHINNVQFQHWQRFFSGTPDKAFKDFAQKIGTAHEKCLLSSDLYVASSAVILETFIGLALKQHLGETAQAKAVKDALSAIVRMFFLDISYAISAYDNAAARTTLRQVSESLLNTFEVDVARGLGSMASAAEQLNGTIKSIVDLNLGNMQRCRDTVSSIETLTKNLADLAETTQQIENFVKVITDVARKTKLLALNAAIEAARSGEYGRGFSVVANEVKALAVEAENATKDVKRQATEIQRAIDCAIDQVTGSQKLVQEIDAGMASESEAIGFQNSAVREISTNLATVSESAHGLRARFKTLDVA